jgi:hypothetical protein
MPSVGKQNGSVTVSTILEGSKKLTCIPILGKGSMQVQIGILTEGFGSYIGPKRIGT